MGRLKTSPRFCFHRGWYRGVSIVIMNTLKNNDDAIMYKSARIYYDGHSLKTGMAADRGESELSRDNNDDESPRSPLIVTKFPRTIYTIVIITIIICGTVSWPRAQRSCRRRI